MVMLGTKWPSMMSTCSQSDPWSILSAHSLPSWEKSALRIEGAMIEGGHMVMVRRRRIDSRRREEQGKKIFQ